MNLIVIIFAWLFLFTLVAISEHLRGIKNEMKRRNDVELSRKVNEMPLPDYLQDTRK